MKKKTSLATLAGLALAALAFLKLSVDLPVYGEPPKPPTPPTIKCADGYRAVWDSRAERWVCVIKL